MQHVAPKRPSRLADHEALPRLATVAAHDRATTVEMLELIAEAESRRLFATTEHPSVFAYCVRRLRMSEDMAYKRIQASRAARKHPAILPMLADGRLHLTAVFRLAPHLTPENAAELLGAAVHRSKRDLVQLLAERFPQPAAAEPLAPPAAAGELVPEPVASCAAVQAAPLADGPARVPNESSAAPANITPVSCQLVPEPVAAPAPPAPRCFPLHVALDRETFDDLDYLKDLLGHALPTGDPAKVLARVFKLAIRELEREKFAVTSRSRSGATGKAANPRRVPDAVRRAVFKRDSGHCTFVSADGHRCASRNRLEFDHVQPVAKGGQSTTANLRLRCRTHNQHAAEQAFGAGFMERKRAESRKRATAKRRAARAAEAECARKEAYARELAANEAARARAEDAMPWLRKLGFRAGEVRRAALASSIALPDASLEDRVKHALRGLAPASARKVMPSASSPA